MDKSELSVDVYIERIGRITTTWAGFEHQIDLTIWALAGLSKRKGACITTQIGSVHGRLRALKALMIEQNTPQLFRDELNKLDAKFIQPSLKDRNQFAHSSAWAGIVDGRFVPSLRIIRVDPALTYEDKAFTLAELEAALDKIGLLILKFGELRHKIIDALK